MENLTEIMTEAKETLEKFNYYKVTVLKYKHITPQYFVAQSFKCDIDGDIKLSCCCSAVSRYRAETAEKVNDHAFLFKSKYETVCVAGYHNPLFDDSKKVKSIKDLHSLIDPYRSRILESGAVMIVLNMWGQWRTWTEENNGFYHWIKMDMVKETAINDYIFGDSFHTFKKNRTIFFVMKPDGEWKIGLYDLENDIPLSVSYSTSIIRLDYGYDNIINQSMAKKMCEIFRTMQPKENPVVSADSMPYVEITPDSDSGATLEENIKIRENFYREQLEANGFALEKKPINATEYRYFVVPCSDCEKYNFRNMRGSTIDELEEEYFSEIYLSKKNYNPQKEIITEEYYQAIYSIVAISRNKSKGHHDLKKMYDDLKKDAGTQFGKIERQICVTYYYANPEQQLYCSLIQNGKEICRTLLCYRKNGWLTDSMYSYFYLDFDKKIAVYRYKQSEAEKIDRERQRIKNADPETEKVRVRKLRRRLENQDYILEKSSARKKFTEYDQGLFRIVEPSGTIEIGHCFDATLEECEQFYDRHFSRQTQTDD